MRMMVALFALLIGAPALAQDEPVPADAPPVPAEPIPVAEEAPPAEADDLADDLAPDAPPMPEATPPPMPEATPPPMPEATPPAMPGDAPEMPAMPGETPADDAPPPGPGATDGPYYNITPAEPGKAGKPKTRKVVARNRGNKEVEVREDEYLGVQPGVRDYVPDHNNKADIRQVTWVGFQMIGPGGRVFVQTDAPKECRHVPNNTRTEITLECENTQLRTRNDSRRLDTSFFKAAVLEVDAEQKKGNMTLIRIKLRGPIGYNRSQQGNYQFLDFRAPPTESAANPSPTGS